MKYPRPHKAMLPMWSLALLIVLICISGARGGDGVLPLRVIGEGTDIKLSIRSKVQMQIDDITAVIPRGVSIPCQLNSRIDAKVLAKGTMRVGSDTFNLQGYCRSNVMDDGRYEFFARRGIPGQGLEHLRFVGVLRSDNRGQGTLSGQFERKLVVAD